MKEIVGRLGSREELLGTDVKEKEDLREVMRRSRRIPKKVSLEYLGGMRFERNA